MVVRARSVPYRPTLRACERIWTRCGIRFTVNPKRPRQHAECKDCR